MSCQGHQTRFGMDAIVEQLLHLSARTETLIAVYDGDDRLQYANSAFRSAYFIEPDETPLWPDLMRRNFELRRFSLLDQVEHDRGRPDFQGCCPLAHVRITDDDMEASIPAWIGVRLVARIDERPLVHGVDAHQRLEKIGPLRNLKCARLRPGAFRFDPELSRARKNLTRNQEGQHARHQFVPRQLAPD